MRTFLNLADTQVKVGALFRHWLDTLFYMMNWGTGFWIFFKLAGLTQNATRNAVFSNVMSDTKFYFEYKLSLAPLFIVPRSWWFVFTHVTRVDRVELEIYLPSTFRTHLLLYMILSSVNNIHLCRNLAIILLYYITVFKFQLLYWITIQRSESNLASVVSL